MSALTDTFERAVVSFNQGDSTNLRNNVLDQHVVLNRVDDPGLGPIQGLQDVIIYLDDQFRNQKPQFSPRSITEAYDATGAQGQVSGVGMYQDNSAAYTDKYQVKHQPSIPFQVQYSFVFAKQGNGNWLLTKASATAE